MKMFERFIEQFRNWVRGWRAGFRPDDHQRAQSLLSPYLDGQLFPGDVQWLQAHLQICDSTCPRDLENLRAMVSLLRQLPQAKPPRNFTISPATFVAHPRPARFSLPAYLPTATAVSALLLFLLVSADLGLQFFFPTAPAATTEEPQNLAAAAPEDREAATPPAIGGELQATPQAEALKAEPQPLPSPPSLLRTLQAVALLLFVATGFATAWYTLRTRSP